MTGPAGVFNRALVPIDGSAVATAAVNLAPSILAPDGEIVVVEVIDTVERILAQTTPAGFDLNGDGDAWALRARASSPRFGR